MPEESRILAILAKLGVNTTRIRWRMYQWEKRWKGFTPEKAVPVQLRWMRWPHKTCMHCGALVDREARACPKCGGRMPSMISYRIMRILGILSPEGSPVTIGAFLFLMWLFFGLGLLMQGASFLMAPKGFTLYVFGAWSVEWILKEKEFWRYLSFGLCHIGILHIGFNTMALLQTGPVIESHIGKARMLVVITVTQITATAATFAWYHRVVQNDDMMTAGASGWLFGLIGFGIAYFWDQVGAARAYRDVLVRWAIYALIFGYFMGANNAAHVGGLIGGLALGIIREPNARTAKAASRIWNIAAAISLCLWIVTLVYMTDSIISNWTPGGIPPQSLE